MYQLMERIENETSVPFFMTQLNRPDRTGLVTGTSRDGLIWKGRLRVKLKDSDKLLPWQERAAKQRQKALVEQAALSGDTVKQLPSNEVITSI